MRERGVGVDHSTIYRWVQKYAPEIKNRLLAVASPAVDERRVDETYVKVRGKWANLYRPLTRKEIRLTSISRRLGTPKRFLGKALNGLNAGENPKVINTDKAPTYGIACVSIVPLYCSL